MTGVALWLGVQAYNGDDYQGARIVTKALALKDAVCDLNPKT